MKLTMKEMKKLPQGNYRGVILEIVERTAPHHYVDFVFEIPYQNDKVKLKAGFPATLSAESKLNKFLQKLGYTNIQVNDEFELNQSIGMVCEFIVGEDGKFSKILPETIKPANMQIPEETVQTQSNT